MFVHREAARSRIRDVGQEIELHNDSDTVKKIRAKLQMVDRSDYRLINLGARPDRDMVAHLNDDEKIFRGQRVVWNSTEFEVSKVEEIFNGTKRLLLMELGEQSVIKDLDT